MPARNVRRSSTRSPDPPDCKSAARIIRPYRRRGFFVLAFDVRLVVCFEAGGGAASYFLTSSTTSCHQCSAGPFSNPSSRRRVAANCGSWCQVSQSARVLHVPTITRRSGLSDGLRSCPPTQPGRFFAADRRVRIAVSHSPPAPSFRCTCVTIVIIELVLLGRKTSLILAVSLDYLVRRHTADFGDGLLEELQLFASYFRADAVGQPCDVPARAHHARDEPKQNRIGTIGNHDDGDRLGGVLGCHHSLRPLGHDDVRFEPDQLGREVTQPVGARGCGAWGNRAGSMQEPSLQAGRESSRVSASPIWWGAVLIASACRKPSP